MYALANVCPPPSLTAGLLRQVTYTTTRMGIYNSLSSHFAPKDGSNVPVWQKVCIGLTAGGFGALVGTPGLLNRCCLLLLLLCFGTAVVGSVLG